MAARKEGWKVEYLVLSRVGTSENHEVFLRVDLKDIKSVVKLGKKLVEMSVAMYFGRMAFQKVVAKVGMMAFQWVV